MMKYNVKTKSWEKGKKISIEISALSAKRIDQGDIMTFMSRLDFDPYEFDLDYGADKCQWDLSNKDYVIKFVSQPPQIFFFITIKNDAVKERIGEVIKELSNLEDKESLSGMKQKNET